MNQTMISGLLATILLVVGVAWFANAESRKRRGSDRTNMIQAVSVYDSDETIDGQTLMGRISLQKHLIEKWNQSRAAGRKFSRSSGSFDTRARRELYKPELSISNTQVTSSRLLIGTFELHRNGTCLRFPLMIDRENGNASISAKGKWYSFDKWLVAKQGVHL